MDQESQQRVSRWAGKFITPTRRAALIVAAVALALGLLLVVGPLLLGLMALACRGI